MSKQNNSNTSMSIYVEYLIFIGCILFTILVYVVNTETSKLLSETINLANELANRYQAQNLVKVKEDFGKENFRKERLGDEIRNTSSSISTSSNNILNNDYCNDFSLADSLAIEFLPKVSELLNLPDEKKSIRDFIIWYYQNIDTSITRFVPTNELNPTNYKNNRNFSNANMSGNQTNIRNSNVGNTNVGNNTNLGHSNNASNIRLSNTDTTNIDGTTNDSLSLPLLQKLELYSYYISLKLFYWKNEFIILGIISVFLVIDALIANYLRGYLELKPRIICFVMSRRAILIWGSLIPISICFVNTTTLNTRVMDYLTIGTAIGLASYFYYLPVWSKNK